MTNEQGIAKASVYRVEGSNVTRFSMDVVETVLNDYYVKHILQSFAEEVVRLLVERWMEEHGAEVLRSITADAIAKQIQATIE